LKPGDVSGIGNLDAPPAGKGDLFRNPSREPLGQLGIPPRVSTASLTIIFDGDQVGVGGVPGASHAVVISP